MIDLDSLGTVDAVAWLKKQADGSIDLLITDPAYESLEKHRAKGTTTRLKQSDGSSNEWFEIFKNERFPEFFEECYRVLVKNSHLYVMCDQETMFVIKTMGEQAGFKFWKPIIWDKESIGMGYHYRCRYEVILFFEKGKRKLTNLGTADVLRVKKIIKGYPTEKPLALINTLVEQSSQPGELVADPFFGSGAVLMSAVGLGRKATGNDLSPKAHAHLANRLIGVQG